MNELLGWIATGLFAVSYRFTNTRILLSLQIYAACLWIVYGISIKAVPVIVANLIIVLTASFSLVKHE